VGIFTVKNRLNAEKVEIQDFSRLAKKIKCMDWLQFQQDGPFKFNHLNITKGAFPEETEKQMNGFLYYCNNGLYDPTMKELLVFSLFSILESISFTRKDGQYLRWDERAKRKHGNPGNFRKEEIASFKHALAEKMDELVFDISTMNRDRKEKEDLILYENSILYKLPEFEDNSIDLVVTSPPYCNRYDYTRTYALELAFLGIDDEKLKALRQALLTSTVENQEKLEQLKHFYTGNGRNKIFEQIYEAFSSQSALNEIISVLEDYRSQNKLNNSNIVRMIKNYFFEMCLVIFEMYRVLQKEGVVYMINDNVRYAGETIPVDLILSEFAASAGFIVDKIWILGNGKGNSSQQMGNHGREELRKCLYIWRK
jgi:hypothetical protein